MLNFEISQPTLLYKLPGMIDNNFLFGRSQYFPLFLYLML